MTAKQLKHFEENAINNVPGDPTQCLQIFRERNALLSRLQDIVDSYDDTGCEFSGVIGEENVKAAQKVIKRVNT
jgi:hypothetical protein